MSRIIAIIILACMLCSATAPAQSYSMPLSVLKEKVHELELVCTSDGDGDVLTFNQFKASIKRFR